MTKHNLLKFLPYLNREELMHIGWWVSGLKPQQVSWDYIEVDASKIALLDIEEVRKGCFTYVNNCFDKRANNTASEQTIRHLRELIGGEWPS